MIHKFLADQKLVAFLGAVMAALAGWGSSFQTWGELLQVNNVFGLFGVMGGLLLANAAKSVWLAGGGSDK